MDKEYISEFTAFMSHFLEEHPKVVEEQMRGFNFFWNPKIDPNTPCNTDDDIVPDDHYGFSSLFDAQNRKLGKRPRNPVAVK